MQKFDARQTISRTALANLLGINGTELDDLLVAIDKEVNSPLRISATTPTADSKINFLSSEVEAADLAGKSVGPIAKSVVSFAATTIDFQTAATTGGTVDITFPNSTVGFYRRVAFSLRKDAVLEAVFSSESLTLGALPDPGTLFVEGAIPIGWLDLEATAASPGRFKTAGSSTNIIENKVGSSQRIHRIETLSYRQQEIEFSTSNDASTGNATISSPVTGIVRLTSGSLVSLAGIPALASGRFLIVENKTGNTIFVNNEDATATAANRIQTGTNSNISMPNNATLMFIYDSTSSRWQVAGGSGSGSGAGGTKNYLSAITTSQSTTPNTGNGDFSLGSTTGWSLGTIGTLANGLPTGSPTFGSGASGNLSISAISSGTLSGGYSLSYASSAATTQGNMLASDAFYIDNSDQGKVLTWKFNYKAQTNPSNGNWSGTNSNSFAVAVYDVTNSQWLSTSAVFGMTQSSGVGFVSGSFQTNITTTQLRLVVYNANASAGAITIYFDDFSVGPQTVVQGTPVTDWVSYTPTGGWTSNSTYVGKWRRVGDVMEIEAKISLSGAPNAANCTINLPSGYTIDSTKMDLTNTSPLGQVNLNKNASNSFVIGFAYYNNSTSVVIRHVRLSGGLYDAPNVDSTSPFSFTTNDTVQAIFRVPITGWSSNVQMSNDTDTRIVAAIISGTPQSSYTANTPIVWPTVNKDTHGAYNASTGAYTVPISGYYQINAHINATVTGNGALSAYIDGVIQVPEIAAVPTTLGWGGGATMVYANAGQVITVRWSTNWSSPGALLQGMTIQKISGPAVIAASESVFAAYETSSGQSINNSTDTTVIWNTKIQDTHNSMNTSTGIFTVPISGLYEVTVTNTFTSNSTGQRYITTNQTGSASNSYRGPTMQATSSGATGTLSLTRFKCLAGDQLNTQVFQNSGGSLSLSAAASQNYILIKRIGN